MLFILLTVFVVALLTYLYLKPLIDNLLYQVVDEPVYIHSYTPLLGFALKLFKDPIEFIRSFYVKYGKTFVLNVATKRWVFMYDEQTFLTKVLKSPDLSIEEFLVDFTHDTFGVDRQCLTNEEINETQLKQYHQYLTGSELEVLNKRVHDSLIRSMKDDAKALQSDPNKVVNFFDLFGEFMLYAGCDGLLGENFTNEQRNATPNFYRLFQDFDYSLKLGMLHIPFQRFFYKSIMESRALLLKRFYNLKLNNGESSLVRAREELYRSDKFKHLYREHDIAALQLGILWAAVANTAPLSCWSVVDLLLHPEALEAVKQELAENIPTSSPHSIYEKDTLAKLKILESCVNESIRRILNVTSSRQAMTNTTIECLDKSKIGLRKGDTLMYPAFLKHFDPDLFGANPYEYQYDRFVKRPNQPKAPSIMVFGCGTHMCPGRYWAINEIKILVALIVQHMDFEFINITEEDKTEFRKKLPFDYTRIVGSGGPKKGYEHKFDVKYSYKNLDLN